MDFFFYMINFLVQIIQIFFRIYYDRDQNTNWTSSM